MVRLLVVTLMFILSVVNSNPIENEEDFNSREKRQTSCSMDMFKNLRGCCTAKLPMLIPRTAFENCSGTIRPSVGNMNGTMNKRVEGIRKRISREFGKQMRLLMNGQRNATDTDIMRKVMEMNPMCLFECVFKNQSLLTSNGGIDKKSVESKFLANLNSTWKPVVQDAINNCTNIIANMTMALTTLSTLPTPPANTVKMCNYIPVLFISCIHRYKIMNCPSFDSKNAECSNNLKRLTNCNPFNLQVLSRPLMTT